ncbi:type I polyketide synthase, partial [Paenibacillus sp. A3M_27_13]|uniref:type I polyketide synthase n=1 Tax=Paenibacillus sp. A3M_27_13 TaxID=2962029 RepID=UPI0020B63D06
EREQVKLEAIRGRCGRKVSKEACYAALEEVGLCYGASMRSVVAVWTGVDEGLAELRLPEAAESSWGEYVLHPGLLDGALQSCMGLALGEEDQRVMLPFALESLEVHGELSKRMWAWIRRRKGGGGTGKLDIDLCEEGGRVCVRLSGLMVRAVERLIGMETPKMLPASDKLGLRKRECDGDPLFPQTKDAVHSVGALLLAPSWSECPEEPVGAVPPFIKHVVLLGMENEAIYEDFKQCLDTLPSTEVLNLGFNREPNGADECFSEAATQTFRKLQSIIQDKPCGKVLIQLAIPNCGEQRLLAGLTGMLQTAVSENPQLVGQLIETASDDSAAELLRKLQESATRPDMKHIRYDADKCRMLEWHMLVQRREECPALPCKDNGIYLITGGAGGLGRIMVHEISRTWRGTTLILTGRSAIAQGDLDKLRLSLNEDTRVEYISIDVADREATAAMIHDIRIRHGALHGIIHSAGIHRDNFIIKKTEDELHAVLASKVRGLVNLDQASKSIPLDFVLLFSSLAGAFGNAGQADYAAANGFMDAYAAYRNELTTLGQRHGRTLSINWPLWRDGGMQVDMPTEQLMLQRLGMLPLETATGMWALGQCWAAGQSQALVMEGDMIRLKQLWVVSRPQLLDSPACGDSAGKGLDRAIREVLAVLLETASALLAVKGDSIDPQGEWSEYGFDYALFHRFAELLNEQYGLDLSPEVFYEHPSLYSLTLYLVNVKQPAEAAYEEMRVSTVNLDVDSAGHSTDVTGPENDKQGENDYLQLVDRIVQGELTEEQLLRILGAN